MLNKKERMEKKLEVMEHKKMREQGIKNFKALSRPEQWDIEEDYPRFKKNQETGKWERRLYIAYFPETENDKEQIWTEYTQVANEILGFAIFLAIPVVATTVVCKVMKKYNK